MAALVHEQVDAGRGGGLPVEGHAADGDRAARLGAAPGQHLLDAEAGQAVGEVADRLVVVERGLADPALRALAADDEPALLLRVLDHGEAGVVDRGRAQHDPARLHGRAARAVLLDDLGQGERQLAQALVAGGGHGEHRQAARLEVGADHLGEVAGVRHVDLVEHDDPRAVCEAAAEAGRVAGQLLLQRVHVGDRVAARLVGGAVDDVHEHRAALDVAQEVQAEALALAGARDQARHVGDGEGRLAGGDHAEVRHEGRERVVGDLRPGRGQHRDQRRLARRREPDQPDVGDRPQLEHQVDLVAGLAEQREAGRLAGLGRERGVAEAAAAAAWRRRTGCRRRSGRRAPRRPR